MREIIKLTISQSLTTILVPMLFWNHTSSQCFISCLNRLISTRVESRDLHQHDYTIFIPQAGASTKGTKHRNDYPMFGSLIHSLPGSRVFHGQRNSSHLWQSQVAQLQLGPHLQSFSML
jgi:hypothetical protein